MPTIEEGIRHRRAEPRSELVRGEGLGVSRVRIERQDERGATVNDSNTRMRSAVDSALMTFRATEEALEVEVVAWKSRLVAASEQPLLEREHHLRHVDAARIPVLREIRSERDESFFPTFCRAIPGVEEGVDFSKDFHVTRDIFERLAHERDAAVYETREGMQRLFAAPFLPPAAAVALSMESRTSPRPLAMRTPGGSSGPPWSLLRMPRTVAQ